MELSQPRAKLIAIGGSEDKEGDAVILKEFIRMAKGPKARIVVMTIATDSPKEVGAEYTAVFKRLGVDDVQAVDVSTREHTESEAALKAIDEATGIFFTGGDQLHITSLVGGSRMHALFMQKTSKGVIIAGTSAGASMMGNSMILGGRAEESPKLGAVEIGPGMDFLLGAIIDVHFSERGRVGRLITAVAHFPQDLGLGIDENTALILSDHTFEVIGEGAVTVIDAGQIQFTNLPDLEKHENLALFGVQVHVLPAGYEFDLAERKPIPQPPKGGKTSADKSSGRKKNK